MQSIIQMIRKAMATSEFWLVIAQVAVEISSAPIPEEYRGMAWAYIGFRVLSKVAKFLFIPKGGS